jgi:hypothetical protein
MLTLGTLVVLGKIEPKLLGKCHFIDCTIVFTDDGGQTRAELASILVEHEVDVSKLDIERVDDHTSKLKLSFCDKHPSHSRYIAELWHAPGVIEVMREK